MLRYFGVSIVMVGLLSGGCSALLGPGDPPDVPDQGPGRAMECTEPYVFAGRSSLAALGLADLGGPNANRIGTVWITEGAAPVLCVEWEDGSGMVTILDEPFRPPLAQPGAGSAPHPSPVAFGAIGLILAISIVVSYLAFRRRRPSAA